MDGKRRKKEVRAFDGRGGRKTRCGLTSLIPRSPARRGLSSGLKTGRLVTTALTPPFLISVYVMERWRRGAKERGGGGRWEN